MDYQITCVSDQLVYIRWFRESDDPAVGEQFVRDLKHVLDSTPHPVYILSDLRDGRIDDVETVRDLAELTTSHPHYAGGTAFSQDAYTPMFVGLFSKYSHARRSSELWPTFELALNYLETLAPGVTQGIDWESLLKPAA